MAIHSRLQLITFFVFGFMLSNSIATIEIDGCESEYCAGETISYTCTSDSETILITLGDPNGAYILNEWFNGSSDIGEVESTEEGVWYNKTSDTTINVWFEANMSFDGFVFECSDVDNDTTIDCTIAVNSNVPSINDTSFQIDDPMFCENVTFTWQIIGDDTCLQDFAVEVTPDGNSSMDTIVPKTDRSISLSETAIGNQRHCITVSPRTAQGTGPVSPMRCVTFDVPVQPNNIRWQGNNFQDDEEEVAITIWWMMPDRSRPNVMWYYVSANITETDNGGTSGSGSGNDDDMMNEFLSYIVMGDTRMIQFASAVIGKVYSVTIIAENCYGNSTVATYSFTVERPTPTTTSTMDMTATMSPSPTPTEDTGALATYIIVIIAVVGGVIVAAILAFVIALLICCCVFGGTLICCAAAGNKKHDRNIEMSKTGTHL